MKRARLEQRQRAQVIVIFPLAVLMLLGMAAMAIDGGRLFLGRQELQKAAEAERAACQLGRVEPHAHRTRRRLP